MRFYLFLIMLLLTVSVSACDSTPSENSTNQTTYEQPDEPQISLSDSITECIKTVSCNSLKNYSFINFFVSRVRNSQSFADSRIPSLSDSDIIYWGLFACLSDLSDPLADKQTYEAQLFALQREIGDMTSTVFFQIEADHSLCPKIRSR